MQVTLNISTRDIRVLTYKESAILKWASAPLLPGVVKNGQILDTEQVAGVIDALFNSLKLPRSGVAACVEGLPFTYRILELPRLKGGLMGEAVRRAAAKEIPLPLEELYLEWQITGGNSDSVEVLVVGVPRSHVDSVLATFKAAKVNLTSIGLKSLALAMVTEQPDVLIVDFEPECFEITILSGGMPVLMHTVTPKGDTSSLEDNINLLINELNRTVDFHNITHAKNPIAPGTPLLLSGSLALEEQVTARIGAGTGLVVAPLISRIPLPVDFPAALYAANIGLVSGLNGKTSGQDVNRASFINLNLLNGRRETLARRVSSRIPLLASILAVLFILLLPGYFYRADIISENTSMQAELARLTNRLRLARSQNDQAARTEQIIQNLLEDTKNLEKSHRLMAGNKDAATLIQFMVGTIPAGAYFNGIDTVQQKITLEGEAANRHEVTRYAMLLEDSGKFSGVRIALVKDKDVTDGQEGGQDTGVIFTIVVDRKQ